MSAINYGDLFYTVENDQVIRVVVENIYNIMEETVFVRDTKNSDNAFEKEIFLLFNTADEAKEHYSVLHNINQAAQDDDSYEYDRLIDEHINTNISE